MVFIVIFQKQLKQLLNKTTKLRVQTNLDTRFKVSIKKVSIRKMSTYGSKQGAPGTNSGTKSRNKCKSFLFDCRSHFSYAHAHRSVNY